MYRLVGEGDVVIVVYVLMHGGRVGGQPPEVEVAIEGIVKDFVDRRDQRLSGWPVGSKRSISLYRVSADPAVALEDVKCMVGRLVDEVVLVRVGYARSDGCVIDDPSVGRPCGPRVARIPRPRVDAGLVNSACYLALGVEQDAVLVGDPPIRRCGGGWYALARLSGYQQRPRRVCRRLAIVGLLLREQEVRVDMVVCGLLDKGTFYDGGRYGLDAQRVGRATVASQGTIRAYRGGRCGAWYDAQGGSGQPGACQGAVAYHRLPDGAERCGNQAVARYGGVCRNRLREPH